MAYGKILAGINIEFNRGEVKQGNENLFFCSEEVNLLRNQPNADGFTFMNAIVNGDEYNVLVAVNGKTDRGYMNLLNGEGNLIAFSCPRVIILDCEKEIDIGKLPEVIEIPPDQGQARNIAPNDDEIKEGEIIQMIKRIIDYFKN